jgi:carbon monoxide dehydrogenase subunit G
MEMKGERLLPADRATAWALLNDSEVLKSCVPGCESMTASGEHSYDVVMNAAVGPVKARFKGKLSLTSIEAPSRYRLLFDGQSGQAGFARGEAKIELQEVYPRQTKLIYFATAQVGGKLAQIGSRLVDAAAGAIADKFFAAFAAQLAAHTTPAGAAQTASQPARARFGFWHWLMSFIRHLFSR